MTRRMNATQIVRQNTVNQQTNKDEDEYKDEYIDWKGAESSRTTVCSSIYLIDHCGPLFCSSHGSHAVGARIKLKLQHFPELLLGAVLFMVLTSRKCSSRLQPSRLGFQNLPSISSANLCWESFQSTLPDPNLPHLTKLHLISLDLTPTPHLNRKQKPNYLIKFHIFIPQFQ